MKTVLFVPGYQENLESRDYSATIRAIEKSGYTVTFVPINWMRTTIEDWVKEFNVAYEAYDPKNTILAGFSFGAMTVFMASVSRSPAELWLFSLSPYFAEDIVSKDMKQTWLKGIGHRRVDDFRRINFKAYSSKITSKTLVFYGQQELDKWPIMKERADGVRKYLPKASYVIVDEVGHDVADEKYIKAIHDAI